ncbi:MAG: PspC domain-containing protein [Sciscionella sp.]
MSGTQGTTPRGVEETVKDFWASRPRRPRHGRKIAGVAAGIGDRYGIDPVIIRVALVVTALFGGAGLLCYLLGWLFLAEEGDQVSPFESMIGRGRSSTSTGCTVLLCLALLPAGSWLFGNTWFAGGFLGVAFLVGGLYLLHRSRGHLNRTDQVAPAGTAYQGSWVTDGPVGTTGAVPDGSAGSTGASGWDPLSAAPLAWELPDPNPPQAPPPPPERRSKAGVLVLGLTLLTAGACFAAGQLGATWMTPAHIIGVTLAVLGLGMVGASFARAGRGLIGLVALLAVAGVVLTGSGLAGGWHGLGDEAHTPERISDVRPSYLNTAGDIHLDLRRLPNSGTVRTEVHNTLGDASVVVPENADVVVRCHASAGDVRCLDYGDSGIGADARASDNGRDGVGGLKINLDVTTSAGDVEVTRG